MKNWKIVLIGLATGIMAMLAGFGAGHVLYVVLEPVPPDLQEVVIVRTFGPGFLIGGGRMWIKCPDGRLAELDELVGEVGDTFVLDVSNLTFIGE